MKKTTSVPRRFCDNNNNSPSGNHIFFLPFSFGVHGFSARTEYTCLAFDTSNEEIENLIKNNVVDEEKEEEKKRQ